MKKKSKIPLIYIGLLTIFLGISVIPLKNRICNETYKSVAMAVEYDDVADFFGIDKLTDFSVAGINSVVISDDKSKDFLVETDNAEYKNYPPEKYLGISSEKISVVSKLNLNMVFLVQGDISLIPKNIPNVTAVILSDDFYGEIPADFNYTFGSVEFAKQKEVKKILKNSSGGYRVFKLRWDSDYKKNLEKINRAALERNVGIIILDLSQTTLDYALEYIIQSKKSLAEISFDVNKPASIKTINSNFEAYKGITKIISFFIALLSPVICLLFVSFNYNFDGKFSLVKSVLIFLLIAVFSLLSGTTIAGLLATKDFMLGIDLFRGVKIVSLTPILILIYLLYKENLKKYLTKPLLYGEAIFIGFLLFAVGFYILRTGNYGSITSLEDNFRLFLEKIFFVRPRFKEFLIGHPFMLLAIYLKYKENNFLWKPFFIVGIIGQISIINTFCHIHTPFFVSLLRSFNGIFAGLILGIILIYFYNLIKKYV
ncbi:MAG TPA: hypothetical protein DCX95_05740 [Elusimicrobia bacterium]|nr:hypothetical protein [Elusimicrobiota bacterium]